METDSRFKDIKIGKHKKLESISSSAGRERKTFRKLRVNWRVEDYVPSGEDTRQMSTRATHRLSSGVMPLQ